MKRRVCPGRGRSLQSVLGQASQRSSGHARSALSRLQSFDLSNDLISTLSTLNRPFSLPEVLPHPTQFVPLP
jgi:hypothetical protein